jgi:exodeoxyribonuclease V alpha subunit
MTTLEQLHAAGYLGPLDLRFAEALARIARARSGAEPHPEALLAAALASRQMADGHVCVDLAAPPLVTDDAGTPLSGLRWPAPEAWRAALEKSPFATVAGLDDEPPATPLVVDAAGRVYLQRFWCHQRELARALRERAARTFEVRSVERVRRELVRLFPPSDPSFPWQRAAALTAIRRGLTVVTGGPGTGKTATVVRILALLFGEAVAAGGRLPRAALVAPTGKAAARLAESVEAALPGLPVDPALRELLPRAASTIHRALGTVGSTAPRFRHDADNPLVADVVVVDEASMVDLALMNRLVTAVLPTARLVLLGDRDQLASVEAGAVLGDLCDPAALGAGYSARHVEDLATLGGIDLPRPAASGAAAGLRDAIIRLVHSYRYGERSGIGRLAASIREGDADEALRVLDSDEFRDVSRVEPPRSGGLHEACERSIADGFRPVLENADASAALRAMDGFRVLAAHRRGPFGVEALNARILEILREEGLLDDGDAHSRGRAVLITRNDYTLSLFNGDVGLIVADANEPGRRVAAFAGPDGRVRSFSPARLPTHETAFAITVHKSQGSEVDGVLLVLPETSPVVTRELLYTAVTRARRHVTIQATREAIARGIRAETRRASGLRDLLWSSAGSWVARNSNVT